MSNRFSAAKQSRIVSIARLLDARHFLICFALGCSVFTSTGAFTSVELAAFESATAAIEQDEESEAVPELSRDQIQKIDEIIVPNYQRGNVDGAFESIRAMLPRLSREQIELIDHRLITHDLPVVEQIVAEYWMDRILGGGHEPAYIRLPIEQWLTLNALTSNVERTLSQIAAHAVNQDPLNPPEDMAQYERLFWDAHVMNNLLSNAEQVVDYTQRLAEICSKRVQEDRIDDATKETLERDYDELASKVASAQQMLKERSIELRIYRLEDAYHALKDRGAPKDQIMAAFVVESDGHQVRQFLETIRDQPNGAVFRRGLNDPGLETSLSQMVEEVRTESPAMIQKGQLLFAGLHWWMRGRYGSGPAFYGLLKSPQAMNDPRARFGLYMPIKRPKPTDPMTEQGYQVPTYDRRHHYTWAHMDRYIQIDSTTSQSSYQTQEVVDVNKSNEPVFW